MRCANCGRYVAPDQTFRIVLLTAPDRPIDAWYHPWPRDGHTPCGPVRPR